MDSKNKNSVLIIDDDPALLKMIGEILRAGYAVSCVKSGSDALVLLNSDYVPDIILLDVDMPEMNGFETLKKFKEIYAVKNIPVIFLTGVNKSSSEFEGLSLGAVDYITKPFVKEILLARLKVHLDNGKRLRQLSIAENDNLSYRLNEEKFEMMTSDLTDTEKKVIRLVALGYTNQEIGEMLFYSYNYVKKVVAVIYEKKHVSKRSELKKIFL